MSAQRKAKPRSSANRKPSKAVRVPVSAVMIAKDEAAFVVASVTAALAFADEVVVVDTGSVDETAALARAAGARVVHVPWPGSFADAHNAASGHAAHDLIVAIDADEVLAGSPALFRQVAARFASGGAAQLAIRNVSGRSHGSWTSHAIRVYDRRAWTYVGAVHEALTPVEPSSASSAPLLDERVVAIDHVGYADPDVVRAKARRNADLALAELADGSLSVAQRPVALLHLGRSLSLLVGSGEDPQPAIEALVEAHATGDELTRRVAADMLAGILLDARRPAEAAVFIPDAQFPGAGDHYVALLAGQAMFGMGQVADGLALLEHATTGPLVSCYGHERSPVVAWRALAAAWDAAGDPVRAAQARRRASACAG